MSYLSVSTDTRGISTVTFNRAETFNAMDRQFMDELTATLQELRDHTRVLILAGNGKHFCAGADVNWMRESVKLTQEQNQADANVLANLLFTLDSFPCPTIAKVQGAALGGGTGIVSCCDIVVAADNARFALSEARLGIIPATISPYVLAAIGKREARRYFLTAEQFGATEAHRIGLVHDVCSINDLADNVEEKIAELLKCGPHAQRAAKQLIVDVASKNNDEALRQQLSARLSEIRTGAEAQEGLSAFLEKRKPNWT